MHGHQRGLAVRCTHEERYLPEETLALHFVNEVRVRAARELLALDAERPRVIEVVALRFHHLVLEVALHVWEERPKLLCHPSLEH